VDYFTLSLPAKLDRFGALSATLDGIKTEKWVGLYPRLQLQFIFRNPQR
jgi:hypothetical protein